MHSEYVNVIVARQLRGWVLEVLFAVCLSTIVSAVISSIAAARPLTFPVC
tara:strand:- start:253 stop:402 length:150 start_codon:yes stop_codon:yes gene_type:complete